MLCIRYVVTVLAGLVALSCDSKQPPAEAKDDSTPTEIVESSRQGIPTNEQVRAIHEALSSGDVDASKAAFGDDIAPDFTFGDGITVLSMAAILGNLEATKFMIEIGADPTKGDKRGVTPLHNAAAYSGDSVVESKAK